MIWQLTSSPRRPQIKHTNGFMINAKGHVNAGTPQNKPPRHDPSKAFPSPYVDKSALPVSTGNRRWQWFPMHSRSLHLLSFANSSPIPLPSAHAELSRALNGLEFTRATLRTKLTGYARESIDANHSGTSTKNKTGGASEVLGYAWVPLQPTIKQHVERELRQEYQQSQKKPFENIKELITLFTQVHSVAEPSSHN